MYCFSKVNEHLVIIVLNYFPSHLQTSILLCSISKDLFQTAHRKTRILDMHPSFFSFQGEVRRWGFAPDHLVLVRGEGLWQVCTRVHSISMPPLLSVTPNSTPFTFNSQIWVRQKPVFREVPSLRTGKLDTQYSCFPFSQRQTSTSELISVCCFMGLREQE